MEVIIMINKIKTITLFGLLALTTTNKIMPAASNGTAVDACKRERISMLEYSVAAAVLSRGQRTEEIAPDVIIAKVKELKKLQEISRRKFRSTNQPAPVPVTFQAPADVVPCGAAAVGSVAVPADGNAADADPRDSDSGDAVAVPNASVVSDHSGDEGHGSGEDAGSLTAEDEAELAAIMAAPQELTEEEQARLLSDLQAQADAEGSDEEELGKETREAERGNDVSEALARPLAGAPTDAEALAELEALMADDQEADATPSDAPTTRHRHMPGTVTDAQAAEIAAKAIADAEAKAASDGEESDEGPEAVAAPDECATAMRNVPKSEMAEAEGFAELEEQWERDEAARIAAEAEARAKENDEDMEALEARLAELNRGLPALHGESDGSGAAAVAAPAPSKNKPQISPAIKKALMQKLQRIRRSMSAGGREVDMKNLRFRALMESARKGELEHLKLLLEGAKGDDYRQCINLQNSLGYTPILSAIFAGSLQCVKILHKNGASIREKNSKGLTPLRFAINQKQNAIALYIAGEIRKQQGKK